MNTVDMIKTVLSHENAHMISDELYHRLVARLALLTPRAVDYLEDDMAMRADASMVVRGEKLVFDWLSEELEAAGLISGSWLREQTARADKAWAWMTDAQDAGLDWFADYEQNYELYDGSQLETARCARSSVLIRCHKCDRDLEQDLFRTYIYHMHSPEDAVCVDCEELDGNGGYSDEECEEMMEEGHFTWAI